jgi:uncharacterized membrane protein YesL
MIILLLPVLICVLAALLIFFGVPTMTSLLAATVAGGVAMWFIARAYRRAKHRLDNHWRG